MDELKFERITTDMGLSHNNVWYIIQDREGFMWILTEAGLNRYDGHNFVKYENNPDDENSIQKLNITAMCEDDDGLLWFGTRQGILIHYDKLKESFSHINLKLTRGREHNNHLNDWIHDIQDNKQGNLFLCTGHNGLQVFNKSDYTTEKYFKGKLPDDHPLNFYSVTRSVLTGENMLWISTFKFGIYRYDISKDELVNYRHNDGDKNSLCDDIVYGLFEDSRKNIWVVTHTGLNLYDEKNNNFTVFTKDSDNPKSISNSFVYSIAETKSNELWVGTFDGLNRYDYKGNFIHYKHDATDKFCISSNAINYLFSDRSNVLWIGTNGAGLNKLDCEAKKFYSFTKFSSESRKNLNESIGSLYLDSNGDILSGVRSYDGLFILSKNNNGLGVKKYIFISEELINNNLIHIIQENESVYWLCSYFGDLIEYNKDVESVKIYDKQGVYYYYSLCILNDYLYIAINKDSILKFDLIRKCFVDRFHNADALKNLPLSGFFCLYKDINNELWMGSHLQGLHKFNPDRNELKSYKTDKDDNRSLSDNTIMSVNNDSKGNLWIGTDLGGLCKFNYSDETFERFTGKNGIPNRVTGILEDETGNLWLRADNGLYCFDPVKETARHFQSDYFLQRFDIGENSCVKDKDGTMYFGGIDGITYFNPVEIKDNYYIPNIVITDFQIFNESVKPSPDNPFLKNSISHAKEIILSYKESVFSFEFAALIYNNSEKNQYAYMMEGFDKDWVYCGTRRQATYTNLDPGEYIFKVKASNNDNIWNEEGTSIKIIITPPYWKTWWFKSLGVMSLLSATGLTYKIRINKIQKEKQLQEEYSRKLLASQESERKRIAGELHDSIAHDILILKNNAVIAMNKTNDEETKIELNKISEQSSEALNDVRNISYNLHPQQIEALGLTKAIMSMIKKVSNSSKVNFISDIENIDKTFPEENEVHLFRIIQEAINNIIKHSDSSEAIVKITNNNVSVSVFISDNGKGFNVSRNISKGSLGLSGISERVKILGGTINIESKRGEGTLIKILIPI